LQRLSGAMPRWRPARFVRTRLKRLCVTLERYSANKIRNHTQVQQEINEATEYYSDIRLELGSGFLNELDAAFDRIAADPLQFAEVRPGIRRLSLDRFPYGVYYRVPDAETVRIIAVTHHRRRPGFGMRRK
jgi:plasmid stabilization system protein ParE